mmetsp:Transcript_71769/g.191483  ORF Transcript_71769/g.191483 Transcript_71769/m.191483 type:complete len:271 (+) Transcript_71769:314-1126(+)
MTRQAPAFLRNRFSSSSACSLVVAVMVKMGALRAKRCELTAMHVAVSTLSPVSIQILTPALRSVSSVLATPSCSLSSTPVRPRRSSDVSSSSTASRISASRPRTDRFACSYLTEKAWNSSGSSRRMATTSVRRPLRERLPHSSSSQSENWMMGIMAESAPLTNSRIWPVSSSRTMMPMRFDSDVKGKTSRIAYSASLPSGRRMAMCDRERRTSASPMSCAKLTRATSSGDAAWYSPPSVTLTLWHTARASSRSRTRAVDECWMSPPLSSL